MRNPLPRRPQEADARRRGGGRRAGGASGGAEISPPRYSRVESIGWAPAAAKRARRAVDLVAELCVDRLRAACSRPRECSRSAAPARSPASPGRAPRPTPAKCRRRSAHTLPAAPRAARLSSPQHQPQNSPLAPRAALDPRLPRARGVRGAARAPGHRRAGRALLVGPRLDRGDPRAAQRGAAAPARRAAGADRRLPRRDAAGVGGGAGLLPAAHRLPAALPRAVRDRDEECRRRGGDRRGPAARVPGREHAVHPERGERAVGVAPRRAVRHRRAPRPAAQGRRRARRAARHGGVGRRPTASSTSSSRCRAASGAR